jgi:hypothetical protein
MGTTEAGVMPAGCTICTYRCARPNSYAFINHQHIADK